MAEAVDSLYSKIELFLSGRNLKKKDLLGKCSPLLVLLLQHSGENFFEVGRTSAKADTQNPNWKETITLDYYFERRQNLILRVYDNEVSDSSCIGEVSSSLGDLVAQGTCILKLDRGGQVVVRVDEYENSRNAYMITLHGTKLDKKDFFGKSDPYLIIYKSLPGDHWVEVHRTEVIKKTLDPKWRSFETNEHELCNCDREKPIKIECYDWNRLGKHSLIGTVQVTIEQMLTIENRFELISKKGKLAGKILVKNVEMKKVYTFVDYIRGGLQLRFTVAIDFTGSNLDIRNKKSLHYLSKRRLNPYQNAIKEVGNVIETYNNQKNFNVFGFGGIPDGQEKVSHCFPLNGDLRNPAVVGVDGVLEVYAKALMTTRLSGPTYFNNVIQKFCEISSSTDRKVVYHVLLMLTDGVIDDMVDTRNNIACNLHRPMSIIIIGIGDEDFRQMEELDCDQVKSKSLFNPEQRKDIVQFVPFNRFKGNPVRLTEEVLKELPEQVTEFMHYIGHQPVIPERPRLRSIQIPDE